MSLPILGENTTFKCNKVSDYWNLEIDIIDRYLDQLMQHKYS